MARPVSWLPRLSEIRRSVAESVRSHYSTKDLEQLFQLQPRSAQMLASLLPTVPVGNAQLIERRTLCTLLDRVTASDDPGRELASLRSRPKPPPVRRKLRELVRADVLAEQSGLPANVAVPELGLLTIRYSNMEDLATALHGLAVLLEGDLGGFATLYVPEDSLREKTVEEQWEIQDAAFLREELAAGALRSSR